MGEEIFIPISFFAALAIILWIYFTNRNKERMALIEKGADPKLFKRNGNRLSSLKWGMLLIGAGIGILFGHLLATGTSMTEEVSYFSMIFLFGGISLISYYFVAGRLKNNN